MHPADHLEHLRRETAQVRFLLAAAGDALDLPVAGCPGWTVADLGRHLGATHRWAATSVRTGERNAPVEGPGDAARIADWYGESVELMLTAFAGSGPDDAAWTFGPKPKRAGFWWRRQLHETVVHRLDLVAALETDPGAVGSTKPPPEVAADGVDEVIDMFFPRQIALGRLEPLQHSLFLELTDAPAPRGLFGDGSGDPPAVADATLTGSALSVLLAIWGRIGLDDRSLRIEGDLAAARAVLAVPIVP